MPGAEYGPAKQWPIESFAVLARDLGAQGANVWILGSAKEAALGEAIEQAAGPAAGTRVRNLCGATALVEAVDLLALAQVAVSNDSGLMHIAAAVGTHVVAIYGSSTPDFTPPLTAQATIHYQRLSCSPCFARECPLGHLNCLKGIDAQAVAASVMQQLGRT
jgi:heptosyltransferase-2